MPRGVRHSGSPARSPGGSSLFGHEILFAAYRILATAQPYTDPGPTTLSRVTTQRLTRQAVRRLQDLGYQVTIAPRIDAT